MKKTVILLIILITSSLLGFSEDTGKYRLTNYRVILTPYSDGKVKMEYYQKWQVTEGHIPWITVGLPNNDYQIIAKGLAVNKIADAQESGWSGVRIDLDKDYKPGQSFEIAFTINENKLFYSKDSNYRLEFTPGWYDQAFIDTLEIKVNCFFKLDQVKTTPKPLIAKDGTIIWTKIKLSKGEKFSVELSFPQKLFPKKIPDDNLKAGITGGEIMVIIIIALVVIVILIFIIGAAVSSDDGGYSGGGVFFGGSGGGGGSGLFSGGGGGFGGSSSSCACACVSCACACACAGGGGAGCTRKTRHQCPVCKPQKK